MRWICKSDEMFEGRLKDLGGDLVKRCFKKSLINKQFLKTKAKKRQDLLNEDTRNRDQKSKRIPLVVNFHPVLIGDWKNC